MLVNVLKDRPKAGNWPILRVTHPYYGLPTLRELIGNKHILIAEVFFLFITLLA